MKIRTVDALVAGDIRRTSTLGLSDTAADRSCDPVFGQRPPDVHHRRGPHIRAVLLEHQPCTRASEGRSEQHEAPLDCPPRRPGSARTPPPVAPGPGRVLIGLRVVVAGAWMANFRTDSHIIGVNRRAMSDTNRRCLFLESSERTSEMSAWEASSAV